MNNKNNLEELVPVGDFNIESVFNFFNIKEKNKELLQNALLDIAGLYTTIDWNSNKYVTINLLTKRSRRGNTIYNVNNTKNKRNSNITKKNIIVKYNPYTNANSFNNALDVKDIIKKYTKYTNNNEYELSKLLEIFNSKNSKIPPIDINKLKVEIEKYNLHHLFDSNKKLSHYLIKFTIK
jgi:hypothetical protein